MAATLPTCSPCPPPTRVRHGWGGLSEGETVLYDQAGQRLHFRNGRVVAIDATEGMVINQKGNPLLTLNEDGHVFYGNLFVRGNVYAQHDIMAGDVSLQGHAHSGVQAGGADYLHSMTTWGTDQQWHQTALDALTRLSMSQLINFGEGIDTMNALRDLAENYSPQVSDVWIGYFLYPENAGIELARDFALPVDAKEVAPGFREALSRIFDKHGVGFDAELPYRMRF